MEGQIDELRTSGDARRVIADPYALSPDRSSVADGGGERDVRGVGREKELGGWVGPFVMAPYNTRVVRRSNALLDGAYGRRFRYREVSGFGTGLVAPVKAVAATGVLGALMGGLAFGPTRKVLDRVLPDPGEGPSETTRRQGHFRLEIHTRTSKGARYRATVAATGDPGYAATAMMMGESDDDGRERPLPRARSRPAPAARRRAHPGRRAGRRAGRPAASRGHDARRRAPLRRLPRRPRREQPRTPRSMRPSLPS